MAAGAACHLLSSTSSSKLLWQLQLEPTAAWGRRGEGYILHSVPKRRLSALGLYRTCSTQSAATRHLLCSRLHHVTCARRIQHSLSARTCAAYQTASRTGALHGITGPRCRACSARWQTWREAADLDFVIHLGACRKLHLAATFLRSVFAPGAAPCAPRIPRSKQAVHKPNLNSGGRAGDIIDGWNPKDRAHATLDALVAEFDRSGTPHYHIIGNHCLYNLSAPGALLPCTL